MFKRKLQALKHHNPEQFNIKDDNQFKSAVVWLEDQHIRHYKVEERQNLRNIKSTEWPKHFKQYMEALECPIDLDDKVRVFDWLLGWAVHLEYVENLKLYQDKTSENLAKANPSVPRIISENPLDNLEFESADFKAGVENLAKLLNINKHPDHLVTLKAVCQLVKERFSAEIQQNPNEHIISGKPYPLQEYDLGFDTGDSLCVNTFLELTGHWNGSKTLTSNFHLGVMFNSIQFKSLPYSHQECDMVGGLLPCSGVKVLCHTDYVLNQAAKIMRLLFIKDLRDLQTRINEVIVAVQAITANPKTDSSLGKVGK